MSERIDIKDTRIDNAVELVKDRQFEHADPNKIGEFRYAVWRAANQVAGLIDSPNPDAWVLHIDTVEEQIGPHSSPGDPDSPDEQRRI
ncbi:MAG TPA: hypothetical protein VHA78_00660 [Candidatus Peribacteraceae bacterium]|nr:hypothetical protein [Candidatus Peribacteraceae bacterium]